MPIPTDEGRRHLAFAVSQEAEWVGVSFVQSAGDLAQVRSCFPLDLGSNRINGRCKVKKHSVIMKISPYEWGQAPMPIRHQEPSH